MEVLEEIMKRKSGRVFSEKPIPQDIIDSILEAGRWAPSCANTQAWNYIVLTDKGSLSNAHEALSKGNSWGKKAPVMVIVTSTESGGCPAHNLPYFMMDVGLTTQNMLLQAVHSGLMGHPTAGWDEEMLKEITGIPQEYRIVTVIFFGYEGDIESADERTKEKELKPRMRKELSEIVHQNLW
ncbi:MAG: nitroreductase family protein [Candidatus Thorarchaeota archaeon]